MLPNSGIKNNPTGKRRRYTINLKGVCEFMAWKSLTDLSSQALQFIAKENEIQILIYHL